MTKQKLLYLVSRAFRLNQSQHLAFSIIAFGLLWSFVYARQENVNDKDRSEHQRLLCLHGLGGSGKSTVIRAWIALAQCWFEPEAVFTFAKTGNFFFKMLYLHSVIPCH